MNSITRTWRRISTQLKSNLARRRSTSSFTSYANKKSVRFYAIDTIYYTHSSTEYDRTPSDEEDFYDDNDSDFSYL
ncbi:hypothetical protein EDC94DRAFT_529158 [Helicostylum pulchrum]|nr:hypothetical protein EDC94DRAFT_529158 [Helicostylum pulchrum]